MRQRIDHDEVWRRYLSGETPAQVARAMNRQHGAVWQVVYKAGGIPPRQRRRREGRLTASEREDISRGLAAGESLRAIARELGRAPSTVSREVARNGGRRRYRAGRAEARAWEQACRPQVSKLAADRQLGLVVADKLAHRWSPEQIAGWLPLRYPHRPEKWVSHETIYRSLFVQAKGALKHELTGHLRTRRVVRRPAGTNPSRSPTMGKLKNMVNISERPADVEDRAVPGHWEGDLIRGTGGSAIGTLVERTSRFTMLFRVEAVDAETVNGELTRHILTLPEQLRRSLTWDQGKEMGRHLEFSVATGVEVYFCDPKSPWQRGTNENTNGLLRQYFPKRTSLSDYSQEQLDEVAAELNGRPRKTLRFMTPSEKFAEVLH